MRAASLLILGSLCILVSCEESRRESHRLPSILEKKQEEDQRRPTAYLPPVSEEAEKQKEIERERKDKEADDRRHASEEYKRRQEAALAKLPPVPEGAHVSLLFDKPEYLLGENILAHYCLENRSDEPFTFEVGGDYRCTSRYLRFRVTAIGEDGKAVPDSDPTAPYRCEGGAVGKPELKPGEKWYQSLPLIRYCRFEKPGVYKVCVVHDLGWRDTADRKIPQGEARIKLVMPTERQARGVVEAMYRPPKEEFGASGQRREPYPDFGALAYPVYLPILLPRAWGGCEKALEGIARIPTPEATRALTQLLGHRKPDFGIKAARYLTLRLPPPPGLGYPWRYSYVGSQRQYLVPLCWRPEFAPAVRAQGRRLLAGKDPGGVGAGALLMESVGAEEDLPALIGALDRMAAEAVGSLDRSSKGTMAAAPAASEEHSDPRGTCHTLMRAVEAQFRRGTHISTDPRTPGEAIVLARAIGMRDSLRPKGWETQYAGILQHKLWYVREVALENLPTPAPAALVKQIAERLSDPEVEVRCAACCAAVRTKSPGLKTALVDLLRRTTSDDVLRTASYAVKELGAQAECLEVLASRLDDLDVAQECFSQLLDGLTVGSGGRIGGVPDNLTAARELKARWLKFLRDHREEIRRGKRFKVGEPALTRDLFPQGFSIQREGQPDWP